MKNPAKIIESFAFVIWLFLTIVIALPFLSFFTIIPLNYLSDDLATTIFCFWLLLTLFGCVYFYEERNRG